MEQLDPQEHSHLYQSILAIVQDDSGELVSDYWSYYGRYGRSIISGLLGQLDSQIISSGISTSESRTIQVSQ